MFIFQNRKNAQIEAQLKFEIKYGRESPRKHSLYISGFRILQQYKKVNIQNFFSENKFIRYRSHYYEDFTKTVVIINLV